MPSYMFSLACSFNVPSLSAVNKQKTMTTPTIADREPTSVYAYPPTSSSSSSSPSSSDGFVGLNSNPQPPQPPRILFPVQPLALYRPPTPPLEGPAVCGSPTDSILCKYGTDDDDDDEEEEEEEEEEDGGYEEDGDNVPLNPLGPNEQKENSSRNRGRRRKGWKKRRSSTPTTISIPCAPIRAYTRPSSWGAAIVTQSPPPPPPPPQGIVPFPSSAQSPAHGLGLGLGPSPIPNPSPSPSPSPPPRRYTRLRRHSPRRRIALVLFLKFLGTFLLAPLIVAFALRQRALAPGVVLLLVNSVVTDCVVYLLTLDGDGGVGRGNEEDEEKEEKKKEEKEVRERGRGRIMAFGRKWRKIWTGEGWEEEEEEEGELVRGIAVVAIGLWFGVVWVVVIVGLI